MAKMTKQKNKKTKNKNTASKKKRKKKYKVQSTWGHCSPIRYVCFSSKIDLLPYNSSRVVVTKCFGFRIGTVLTFMMS